MRSNIGVSKAPEKILIAPLFPTSYGEKMGVTVLVGGFFGDEGKDVPL
jgi:hypothetical protein